MLLTAEAPPAGWLCHVQWDEEYRKFEVTSTRPAPLQFRGALRLGMPEFAISQEQMGRAPEAVLEDVRCRRLDRETPCFFTVAHQARSLLRSVA